MTAESHRQFMERTGKCQSCGHAAEKHRYNKCEHADRVMLARSVEYRKCDCWRSGPEGWEAAAMWNSYMGRSVVVPSQDPPKET